MNLLPQGFDLDAPTWFYLSLLLILAIFFRFHRIWSLRNLDLLLLLSVSPGLILLTTDETGEFAAIAGIGRALLVSVTAVLLVRLLLDGLLQRRPHTTQNLNPAGLAFLCASAFVLLSMYALRVAPEESDAQQTMAEANELLTRTVRTENVAVFESTNKEEVAKGPASAVMAAGMEIALQPLAANGADQHEDEQALDNLVAGSMAMGAHLAVIAGLLLVGRNLFGDLQLGTAMATLYMLIPCTATEVGAFIHILPAALIVWAVVAYQRPIISGALLGMACGTLVFPVFLVPIWTAFYGRRGGVRFLVSLAVVVAALLSTYALTSDSSVTFWQQATSTVKMPLHALWGADVAVSSWNEMSSPWRIPIVAAFFVMLVAMTIWPRKKTVEHLLAQSTAIIVGTQFWYPEDKGSYLLWYLPLLLIVVFRPRLTQLARHRSTSTIADVKPATTPAPAQPASSMSVGNPFRNATLFR